MKAEFLVGGKAFIHQLSCDIAHAKERIYVQSMTFEMDAAGTQLMTALSTASAPDQRLIVDSYSQWVINDRFMFWPLRYFRSLALRDEYRRTLSLIKSPPSGILAKLINPLGFLGIRYPFRNHKKCIVIDQDVIYLGGINFSDHNFAWYDFMLRIQDTALCSEITKDFLFTWQHQNQSKKVSLAIADLYFLNGIASCDLIVDILSKISAAQQSITVLSAYLSPPFLEPLLAASRQGISVTLVFPWENNKPIFNAMIQGACADSAIRLTFCDGMHHLKAILIDDTTLITGSCNFDFISYCFEQETVMVTSDPDVISQFEMVVLRPVLAKIISTKWRSGRIQSKVAYTFVKMLSYVLTKIVLGLSRPKSATH